MEEKGNLYVVQMLKMKIDAKSNMVKRYKERQAQFRQTDLVRTDQKRLYSELNGEETTNDPPNPEEATHFWKEIWGKSGTHKKDAGWLAGVKDELNGIQKMENIHITTQDVRAAIKKMARWKAPGFDGVHGFWFGRLTKLHQALAYHLQKCVDSGFVPTWMTQGKTVLIQKDPSKGTAASNYRPIACLLLMWKLLTSMCADKMYDHLSRNMLLPDEQKGCRKKSRGTKDQLLIDKVIMHHCHMHQRNLAMAWIDYKKAYDMVPHSWLLETVKMVGIADNIVELLEKSMRD